MLPWCWGPLPRTAEDVEGELGSFGWLQLTEETPRQVSSLHSEGRESAEGRQRAAGYFVDWLPFSSSSTTNIICKFFKAMNFKILSFSLSMHSKWIIQHFRFTLWKLSISFLFSLQQSALTLCWCGGDRTNKWVLLCMVSQPASYLNCTAHLLSNSSSFFKDKIHQKVFYTFGNTSKFPYDLNDQPKSEVSFPS